MLNSQEMLSRAIAIASQAFDGRFDKGGHPYILHCLRVMMALPMNDPELRAIGVIHDLVEDTDWTFRELINEGFSDRVIHALMLLTHNKATDYDEYVRNLARNVDARLVKLADLRDNSDITRLKGLMASDFARLEKYSRSYVYLSKV